MGSLFRSEEMSLVQLFLQAESSYACVRELGELGMVQFRDLNPEVNVFQRKFTLEVRRCDEMERKLRFLGSELEKNKIQPHPSETTAAPDPQDMIEMEGKFEVLEGEVKEIAANQETLKRNLLDLVELRHVLCKTRAFLQEAESGSLLGRDAVISPVAIAAPGGDIGLEEVNLVDKQAEEEEESGKSKQQLFNSRFMFVSGVISRQRLAKFERVLWRACRGNVFLKQAEIEEPLEDPTTGEVENKVVFILFFQGLQLHARVRKICEGFQATLYQCPELPEEQDHMTQAVEQRISDLKSVIQTTQDHAHTQLGKIARKIETWQTKVKKIKGIYHTMNLFNLDVTLHCLIAECWCPVEDLELIRTALNSGSESSGSRVAPIMNRMTTKETPPTYNKVNKFTRGFQAIVDAYGVATYQEVNPAPYTIITFPFLFAVMFGDAGHGLLMSLFALSLIIFEKRLEKTPVGGEMFMTLYSGRYIILLMGVFSMYTGLIYNDIFSKSFNLFGSTWNASYTEASQDIRTRMIGECCPGEHANCVIMGAKQAELTTFPREAMARTQPYPFGIDPIWNVAENKLLYINSYKMKQAFILGVVQMLFGVILSAFNHVHFKRYLNLYLEFVPQVLFLMCIFGWLVFLVFFKWSFFYDNPNQAPSLLITLIGMFLSIGASPKVYVNGTSSDQNEYSTFGASVNAANGQCYFQVLLVLVAVSCIPWMLCVKPFCLCHAHRRVTKNFVGGGAHYSKVDSREELALQESDNGKMTNGESTEVLNLEEGGKKSDEEEFDFSEAFVHQAIHTIEYCLGTISNTASYLRLWALSLAHAQLSEVLWNMALRRAVGVAFMYGIFMGALAVCGIFAFWAMATVGILLVMESLSAFLHALRLHWVEFQNKFYNGEGYKFKPFSFKAILEGQEEDYA